MPEPSKEALAGQCLDRLIRPMSWTDSHSSDNPRSHAETALGMYEAIGFMTIGREPRMAYRWRGPGMEAQAAESLEDAKARAAAHRRATIAAELSTDALARAALGVALLEVDDVEEASAGLPVGAMPS